MNKCGVHAPDVDHGSVLGVAEQLWGGVGGAAALRHAELGHGAAAAARVASVPDSNRVAQPEICWKDTGMTACVKEHVFLVHFKL